MENTGYQPRLTAKETKALELVKDRLNTYKDYRKQNYDERWDSYWQQYRSQLENENEYPYRARLFIPYSFTAVETAIPRMTEAIFSSDPIIAVKPITEDDIERAKIMEMLLDYQIKRMEFFDTFVQMAKDCFIIGSCFAKVDWRHEYRKKKRPRKEFYALKNPITEEEEEFELIAYSGGYEEYLDVDGNPVPIGKPLLETIEVPYYDDPYIYYVDPYKIFLDPKASPINPIETSEAVILVTESTIPKLRQMEEAGIYKKISEVEKCKNSAQFTEGENRYSNMNVTKPSQVADSHSERVLLYEYWEDNRVIVVAEEKVVIRDEENPYWHCRKPFIEARICPTNEIYGIGFMEMIECLQAELNDRRNQRADNITLALNRMWVIARDADIDIDSLVSEPGGVIMANYVEGIKNLDQNDVTQSSFAEVRDMVDDIDRALGIHDPSRGKPTDRETATGVIALQEQANMRFKQMVMVFGKNILKRGADLMVGLNEQYVSEEKVFRLTNGEFLKIDNIEDIVANYDFEPAGATLEGLSKYAKQEQMLRFRAILADNPDFKKTEFDKDLVKLSNFGDAGKYFYTEEEKQAIMQQQMATQQQQIPGMESPGGQMESENPIGDMLAQMQQMPSMEPPEILPGGEAEQPEFVAGAGRTPPIFE